jgi:ADP-ribosylglycohydrolase
MHALRRAIHLGGDTDTRASIVGALLGARWGKEVFPYTLVSGVERSAELLKLDEQLVRRG